MSNNFILGNINVGDSYLITSIQGGKPFFLNGFVGATGDIGYYWEGSLTAVLNGTTGGNNLPVFSSSGSADIQVTTRDTGVNGGGLGVSNGVLTNVAQPAALTIGQSSYAVNFPPALFYAGPPYTILSNGSVVNIATSSTPNSATIPANNIFILPVTWYGNCDASGNYDQINTPLGSLLNWFCLVEPGLSVCAGETFLNSGWTDLNECLDDLNYSYCSVGSICGDSNCNGPCTAIYYDCTASNGNFSCVFDPDKFFEDTKWWESPYFIGGVIGLVLLIIILINLFLRLRR